MTTQRKTQGSTEITVLDRKGKELFKEKIDLSTYVIEFKKLLASKTRYSVERQYLTLGKYSEDKKKPVTMNDGHKQLSEYPLEEGNFIVTVKDLGPQVGWRTVFIVEYAGPIIVFSLLYLLSGLKNKTDTQCFAYSLILIHYLKRELESCFLHVFSRDTMPFKRIFINSFHYWITGGAAIAIELFYFWKDPGYSKNVQYILFGLMCLFEFMNFQCHRTLLNLRASLNTQNEKYGELKAKSSRGIPRGWGFDFVTCANYWWETCAWLTFAILVRCWTAYIFLAFSFYQMAEWAVGKHKNLKKEFDGTNGKEHYPRGRKAIIPFVF